MEIKLYYDERSQHTILYVLRSFSKFLNVFELFLYFWRGGNLLETCLQMVDKWKNLPLRGATVISSLS